VLVDRSRPAVSTTAPEEVATTWAPPTESDPARLVGVVTLVDLAAVRAMRRTLPQIAISFNYFLDIAFTIRLLCVGNQVKPTSNADP
jgi:hypothetical protein